MTGTGFAMVMVALLGLAVTSTSGAPQAIKGVRADLTSAADRTRAPNFALNDTTGRSVRLSDYLGHVVLLDFWATTCGGCVEEMPMFIDVATSYERRGLATVGVSEDIPYASLASAEEAWARVRPFVRDHAVPYPIVMGDNRVTADYHITALPLTYLIDTKGRVAATYRGVVERARLEANLKTLLVESR